MSTNTNKTTHNNMNSKAEEQNTTLNKPNSFDKYKRERGGNYNHSYFDLDPIDPQKPHLRESELRDIRFDENHAYVEYAFGFRRVPGFQTPRMAKQDDIFVNFQRMVKQKNFYKIRDKLTEEPSEEVILLRQKREKISDLMRIVIKTVEDTKIVYKNQTIRLNKEYHERFPNGNKILNPDVWGVIKSFIDFKQEPINKKFKIYKVCHTGGLYRIVIKRGTKGWNFNHTKSDYLIKLDIHKDMEKTINATISFYKDDGGERMKLIDSITSKRFKKGVMGRTEYDQTEYIVLKSNKLNLMRLLTGDSHGKKEIYFDECRYYGKKDEWGNFAEIYTDYDSEYDFSLTDYE